MSPLLAPSNSRFLQWAALVVLIGAGVTTGLVLGRDIPWDYYNYHAYSAYLLFHGGLGDDYFAAGQQGYMNPIGFLPFAFAQEANLTSRETGALLSALHSLNYVAAFLLCRDLIRLDRARMPHLVCGCILAITTPILLIHLGSTFTDPIGSALVLFAAWLIVTKQSSTSHAAAGFLLAAATAIKPTNAVFVIALCGSAAWPWAETTRCWRTRCGGMIVGGLAGAVITQGYWSWQLNALTGNPFFPFLNGIFRSPWLSHEAPLVGRFVPDSLPAALQRPLLLARLESWGVLEMPAPMIVPLVAAGALLVFLGLHVWRIARPSKNAQVRYSAESIKLAIAVAFSWCLWLYTSGNARYAIALFLLLGPATALLLRAVMPSRYAVVSCALVTVAQLGISWDAGVPRWGSQQWTRDWVSVDAPSALRESPFLYLSLADQSHTELIRFVHPESSFVHLYNLQHSVPSEGPASEGLHRLLSKFRHRTKVIIERPSLPGLRVATAALVAQANDKLDRVSLRIEENKCARIDVNAAPGDDGWPNMRLAHPRNVRLFACDAEPTMPRHTAERRAMEYIFDAFERRCSNLFSPAAPQIENVGGAWVRSYSKYDSIALIAVPSKNQLMYSLSGQSRGALIGTLDNWQQTLAKFDCALPFGGKRGIAGFEEELMEYERGTR